ncbi:MAG: YncE family protein [Candidatus Acidiferrales bacterium]
MRLWKLCALALVAACVVGCGGNSTPVGITITAPGVAPGSTVTVNLNGHVQFAVSVTGTSTGLVFWQICLVPTTSGQQPTMCTQGIGPAGCTPPTVSKPVTGLGTITSTGLYTAPGVLPSPDTFAVMASSCASPTTFNLSQLLIVQVVAGVSLSLKPASATIETGEKFLLALTVTGTQDKSVTWTVTNGNNPPVVGGNSTIGFICPNPVAPQPCPDGTYVAPNAPPPQGVVQVRATSSTDGSPFAQSTISIVQAVAPTISSINPATATTGSVQQDVYVSGTNFFITSTVVVGANQDPVPTTFIDGDLLRATIPASELSGNLSSSLVISVQQQNGSLNTTGSPDLILAPTRPTIIASDPDSITQSAANVGVTVTGGYYSPGTTTATFNGQGTTTSFVDSRDLSVGISFGAPPDPGLYPIVVQNSGVAAPSAVNLAVVPSTIPSAPGAPIAVGSSPSAVAIDSALHLAVVINQGDGTASLLDLGSNTVVKTIAIPTINGGTNKPTAVAVDDIADAQLPHDLALVVNNGDNSLTVIDLVTQTVTKTIDLTPFTPMGSAPFSIGVNPLSHRGFVTDQSTNLGTVIDLVTPNPNLSTPCTTPPCVLTTIGGSLPPFYSVGSSPAISVDPRLNWAVVTPGGAGVVNFIDLGRNASAGDGGRQPRVLGTFTPVGSTGQAAVSTRGVGINTETHQLLLTDPQGTLLTTFSLLDQSVNTTSFTNSGIIFSESNLIAAAVNPLDNVGIVVNGNGSVATVVDLTSGNVLRQDIPVGNSPQAIAVDQATNRAVIVNQGGNSVSILALGSSFRSPQIVEASPAATFAQTASPLRLTINGIGFVAGSKVLLDGAQIATVSSTPSQIVASIPAAMLGSAHRYIIAVQNPGQMSNVTDLTVIKAVSTGPSGSAPFGVAVDNERDLAVITNTGNGTVGLVDLVTGTLETPALSSAVTVGTSPEGVGVLPLSGKAVVANFGSDDFTVVNITGTSPSQTVSCGTCVGPTGVATNQDTGTAALTANISNSVLGLNAISSPPAIIANTAVDQGPGAVAIDPNPDFNFTAVATTSQSSTLDLVNSIGGIIANRVNNLQVPTGVIFDPLNQFFIVANSLQNNLVLVDPSTFIAATVRVGINPTALDYNFQTSTLVTVNSASNTISVIEYLCPPLVGQVAQCPAPRTRAIVALPDSGQVSLLKQFSVGIDLKMNLAVVVDQNNDRVLLIPLPH